MRTVLITGGAGYLGSGLLRLAPPDVTLHATRHVAPIAHGVAHTVDLAEADQVLRLWERVRPDVVVHTAYRADQGERDIWAASRNVVDACRATGAELVHLSTDMVLGAVPGPYSEDSPPAPVSEYGRWKARVEDFVRERLPAAAVVRTSLITSFAPLDPRSEWVAAGLRGEHPLTLFTDEIRTPIALSDLVAQLWELTALPAPERAGVWHLAAPEALSRFALGALIAVATGQGTERVVAASVRNSSTARPADVRLLTARADRALRARARTLAEWAAEARVARLAGAG